MDQNKDDSSSSGADEFHDCKDNKELVPQSMEISVQTKEEATKIFKQGDIAGAIEKYKYAILQAPESEV